MKTNNDLEKLWKTKVNSQRINEVELAIKQNEQQQKRVRWYVGIIGTLTLAYFCWLYNMTTSSLLITKLGLIVAILAVLGYIGVFVYLQRQHYRVEGQLSTDSVNYLKALRNQMNRNKWLARIVYPIYAVVLLIGIVLGTYEYTATIEPIWRIGIYVVLGVWVVICLSMMIAFKQKQENRIRNLIEDIENSIK